MRATGPAKWNVRALADEEEPQLKWRCPQCKTAGTANLQPLPWSTPVEEDLVDTPQGRVVDEQRRARGKIRHQELPEVATQVWCHRCGIGADVTVTAS